MYRNRDRSNEYWRNKAGGVKQVRNRTRGMGMSRHRLGHPMAVTSRYDRQRLSHPMAVTSRYDRQRLSHSIAVTSRYDRQRLGPPCGRHFTAGEKHGVCPENRSTHRSTRFAVMVYDPGNTSHDTQGTTQSYFRNTYCNTHYHRLCHHSASRQ